MTDQADGSQSDSPPTASPIEREVSFNFSRADYVEWSQYLYERRRSVAPSWHKHRKRVRHAVWAAGIGTAWLVFLFYWYPKASEQTPFFVYTVVGAVLFLWWRARSLARGMQPEVVRQRIQADASTREAAAHFGPMRVHVGPQGLLESAGTYKLIYSWDSIFGVDKRGDHLFIRTPHLGARVVCSKAFDTSASEQEFVHLIEKYIGAAGSTDVRRVSEYLAEHDKACPGCGYNLRGCAAMSCPECGAAIDASVLPEIF